jgi:signal transduction histidine kinase
MSINLKTKLGIWYLIVMLLLSFVFFIGMYYALTKILFDREHLRIKEQSSEATHYISVENGKVKIVGDYLQNFIDHGGFAAIYDMQGKLLAGKMPGDAVFPKSENLGDTVTITASDIQIKYIIFDTRLNDGDTAFGWLRMAKIQYSEKALRNMVDIYLVAVPIYVGLAVLGGLLLIIKALSPISKIISKAKTISSGNLSVRIGPISRHDEVGQLSASIDQMMDSIESAYNRQKQFAQDASHELRTPITVITTTAEDALTSAVSIEDCKEALRTVLDKGNKMSSLISQLLMITKGFSENYEPEVEVLDLSISTQTIVDELSSIASDAGISLHANIEPGIAIRANQTLLTRMIINLIENAIKYNRPGGNVWIDVHIEKNQTHLAVKDDGIGISEKDIPLIWDRFYKVDRSRADSGTGLGLAMVKWVADLYGATIRVQSEIDIGSSFEVVFSNGIADKTVLHQP